MLLRLLLSLGTSILAAPPLAAADLGERDTGTFVVLDREFQPTEMFFRLSRPGRKWVMEGKLPGKDWEGISCETGCQFRPSTSAEVALYFPEDWRARLDIACIQNIAQAFCRGFDANDRKKAVFLAVALVTGKPVPLFLRRVPSQ